MTPTLAAISLSDLIYLVLVIVFVFGSYIFNMVRKMRQAAEERERKERQQLRELQAPGTALGSTGVPSADQVAARRRAELAALAQRRGSTGSPPTAARGGGVAQPNNLTLEQMRERARAKAEYERRVAALRQQQTASGSTSAQPFPTAQPRRPAAPRPTAPPRRPMQTPTRAPQPPRAPALPTVLPPVGVLGEGVSTVSLSDDRDLDAGESVVHRHVPDLKVATVVTVSPRVSARTLRQAVILREVLGRPLALREMGEE